MSKTNFYNAPVEKFMKREFTLVTKNSPIRELAKIVSETGHVWVTESKDSRKVVGVVTEKDFLDVVSPLPKKDHVVSMIKTKSLCHTKLEKAEDIMSEDVIKCQPGTTMEEVLHIMTSHRIRRIMVVEAGEIVGEISVHIIMNAYFPAFV
ncbi:MAG: CBS domain-containing protein [Dehalococcoidia bacterium]|nr:CBS domain-containing protein [Dehalococcoidia bacterium]